MNRFVNDTQLFQSISSPIPLLAPSRVRGVHIQRKCEKKEVIRTVFRETKHRHRRHLAWNFK